MKISHMLSLIAGMSLTGAMIGPMPGWGLGVVLLAAILLIVSAGLANDGC